MSVRIGLVRVGIASLGVLTAACAMASGATLDPPSGAPTAPGSGVPQTPVTPPPPPPPPPSLRPGPVVLPPATNWTQPPPTTHRYRPHPPPAPPVSWLELAPDGGEPGQPVWLDLACADALGPVESPALDIGPLSADSEGHQPWHLSARATVRGEPGPGDYPVTAQCGDRLLSSTFTVFVPPPPPGGAPADVQGPVGPQAPAAPQPQAPAAGAQQVPRAPRGPVETGGGATAPAH